MIHTEDSFIGVYENVLTKFECDKLISEFEKLTEFFPENTKYGLNHFQNYELGRNDTQLFLPPGASGSGQLINNALNKCIEQYSNTYWSVKQISARSFEIKLQKTLPRGGYHTWHCESTNRESMERVLAWMIYLNDVPDNEGETEFLWQKVKVKPVSGRCVIWPAMFTHTHRGNPVYSCNKYIATGWYVYDFSK